MRTDITFIPLAKSDFPLLLKWLEASHVKAWWDQDIIYTFDLVEENFSKHLHQTPISNSPNKLTYAYIAFIDTKPIAYIQAYHAHSFAQDNNFDEALIPPFTAGSDIFIGEPEFLGKGLGAKILQSFCDEVLFPYFDYCIVDPATNNLKAKRSFTLYYVWPSPI